MAIALYAFAWLDGKLFAFTFLPMNLFPLVDQFVKIDRPRPFCKGVWCSTINFCFRTGRKPEFVVTVVGIVRSQPVNYSIIMTCVTLEPIRQVITSYMSLLLVLMIIRPFPKAVL